MSQLAKYQMFGIVRDKATGKPKIDDPSSLHPIQCGMLTRAELEEFGVWPGHWARDAQGIKRVEETEDGRFIATDALVAVNELFISPDDGSGVQLLKIEPRCDVAAGAMIPAENVKG